ncbi:hypothetical protein ACWV95_23495 [Streptomyces albus]
MDLAQFGQAGGQPAVPGGGHGGESERGQHPGEGGTGRPFGRLCGSFGGCAGQGAGHVAGQPAPGHLTELDAERGQQHGPQQGGGAAAGYPYLAGDLGRRVGAQQGDGHQDGDAAGDGHRGQQGPPGAGGAVPPGTAAPLAPA